MQHNLGANGSRPRTVPHSPAFPGCMIMDALVVKEGRGPAAREGELCSVARFHALSLKVVPANTAADLTESSHANVAPAKAKMVRSTLGNRPGTGHTKPLRQPTARGAGCCSITHAWARWFHACTLAFFCPLLTALPNHHALLPSVQPHHELAHHCPRPITSPLSLDWPCPLTSRPPGSAQLAGRVPEIWLFSRKKFCSNQPGVPGMQCRLSTCLCPSHRQPVPEGVRRTARSPPQHPAARPPAPA